MPQVILAGALDTKAAEYCWVRDELAQAGLDPLLVDVGVRGRPEIAPDVSREEVARAAGSDMAAVAASPTRSGALETMAEGLARLVGALDAGGQVAGAFGMGGSGALTVLAPAFSALPLGVPKMIVTTMAASDTRPYIGASDLLLVPSVVDIAGLNSLSRFVLGRAVRVLTAQLGMPVPRSSDTPMVAASMFGVTTTGVTRACRVLEARGLDVLVFHANGMGGRTLENLAADGWVSAVLDLTTTEIADELFGGIAGAGAARLSAAGARGIPQVVAPGAMDIVNFGAPQSVPESCRGRRLYAHSATATLMRTTPEESAVLGRVLGEKLLAARGPTSVVLPTGGLSALSEAGAAFSWPEADLALESALLRTLGSRVAVVKSGAPLNSPEFGELAAAVLLETLATQ